MLGSLLCTLTALAAPQTPPALPGMPEHLKPRLGFTAEPGAARSRPFVDSTGSPLAVAPAAAGLADFDGDGCADAWFLGSGPAAGRLSVMRGRTWALGRYSTWPWPQGSGERQGPWLHAATHRSLLHPRDRLLLVDPNHAELAMLHYSYPPATDPKLGQWQQGGSGISLLGNGGFEIVTSDDVGDGHDDILALRSDGAHGTHVETLRIGASGASLHVHSRASFWLPAPASHLRAIDINGDQRTDAAVWLPGFGVGWLIDDGTRLVPAGIIPLGSVVVRDIVVADLDQDGKEDLCIVVDAGVLLATNAGTTLRWLPSPAGVGSLSTAALLDADGDGKTDVVVFPVDGRSFAIHAWLGPVQGYAEPLVRHPKPENVALYHVGPGTSGVSTIVADFDGDGDADVLWQLPNGADWIPLDNPSRSFTPPAALVIHDGPVGETGYLRERLTVRLPDAALAAGVTEIELVVMLRTRHSPECFYWGRTIAPVDPQTGEAEFKVYMLSNHLLQPAMIAANRPHYFPDGVTAGGETLLSFHGKSGPKRFGSLFVHHDPGGDGNKSGLGVRWDLRAAPPVPGARDEVLPWD